MNDRYVIVSRDGDCGADHDKARSDDILRVFQRPGLSSLRPAYRIRIREKARYDWTEVSVHLGPGGGIKTRTVPARLDPLKALREVTGRTVAAGAEK